MFHQVPYRKLLLRGAQAVLHPGRPRPSRSSLPPPPLARLNDILQAEDLQPPPQLSVEMLSDGSCRYRNLQVRQMLILHRRRIYLLMERTHLTREQFAAVILPLLEAAAAVAGVLPASRGCHDLNATGLFCHSLEVCIQAVEELAVTGRHGALDPQRGGAQAAAACAALVVMGMAHDLGKIFTDMDVHDGARRYDPFAMTMAEFMAVSASGCSTVVFREQRTHRHDELIALALTALLQRCDNAMALLGLVAGSCSLQELFARSGMLWKLVRDADCRAVGMASALGKYQYDAPRYAVERLIADVQSGRVPCSCPGARVFHTQHALLLACDSEAAVSLYTRMGAMCCGADITDSCAALPDATRELKGRGYVALLGSSRIYGWYRLTLGGDLLYVFGLMLRTGAIAGVSEVNCAPLGPRPPELAPVLEVLADRPALQWPGIITLRGQALYHGVVTPEMLDEDSVSTDPALQAYRQLIEEREVQRRVLRNHAARSDPARPGPPQLITGWFAREEPQADAAAAAPEDELIWPDDDWDTDGSPQPAEPEAAPAQEAVRTRRRRSAGSAGAERQPEDAAASEGKAPVRRTRGSRRSQAAAEEPAAAGAEADAMAAQGAAMQPPAAEDQAAEGGGTAGGAAPAGGHDAAAPAEAPAEAPVRRPRRSPAAAVEPAAAGAEADAMAAPGGGGQPPAAEDCRADAAAAAAGRDGRGQA